MPITVIVTILFFWLFRTMRWFILLKAAGIKVNFFYLYLVSSISVAFAIITPFQSGETLKVELLKKIGILERVPGYGIFVTERILDLIIVLLMAMLNIVFGASKFLDRGIMFSAFGLILICFLIFFIIVRRLSPDNAVGRFFQPFNQCVRNGKILASVVILTIGGWFFIVMGWYASLRSISISINRKKRKNSGKRCYFNNRWLVLYRHGLVCQFAQYIHFNQSFRNNRYDRCYNYFRNY